MAGTDRAAPPTPSAPRRAEQVLLTLAPAYSRLIALSLLLLLLVGWCGESLARPDLGPRGWAPGTLPWHPGGWTTTVLLFTAYLVGGVGVAVGLLAPAARHWTWGHTGLLAALALLTGPLGSADHLNYAAYGRILVGGGNPWTQSPIDWAGGHDPVTGAVEAPWTTTPSIYGPLGTAAMGLASWAGGDNLRQTVWVLQLVVVLSWLAVRAALLRVADEPVRVDVLWTANPVVFGVGVLGCHIDMLATALAVAAVVAAHRSPFLGGLLTGLAVATKVTYGCVALALLLVWLTRHARAGARRAAFGLAGLVLGVLPLYLWAGPHVFDQLGRARRSISLATPWRPFHDLLALAVPEPAVRTLVSVLAAVLCLLLAAALARLTRRLAGPSFTAQVARWVFVLATAYALAAPYSLPWYDQLSWATLPVLAASTLDLILLGRAGMLATAYVPGRAVGLEGAIGTVTLSWRRHVTPYVVLLVWVLVGRVARGSWTGRRGRVTPS